MKTSIYFYYVFSFLYILSSFFNTKIFSQTYVGGLIDTNTTWSLSGSPYIIVQNILIDSGYYLNIEPGVEVRFENSKLIQVRGGLSAPGTVNQKIRFTSNSINPVPGDWSYILFEDESSTISNSCVFINCIFEYGGIPSDFGGVKAVLMINHWQPYIDSCIFQNNLSYGIYSINQSLQLKHCVFNNNGDGSAFISSSGLNFSNNVIKNNGFQNNSSYEGLYLAAFFCTINDNIICNNSGGIKISGSNSSDNCKRNIFFNNSLGFGRIELYHSNNLYSNNIFARNYNVMPGLINVFIDGHNNITGTFTKNQIIDNVGYFFGYGNSKIIRNTFFRNNSLVPNNTISVSIYEFPEFTNNNIFNNYSDLPQYELRNENLATTNNLNLENNWWGTTNSNFIQSALLDWFEDPSLGIIDYSPFLNQADTLAPISPPMNVVKSDLGGGSVQLTWSPNPELDIAGYKIYWHPISCCDFQNSIDVENVTSYTLSGVSYNDTIAVTAYDNLRDGNNDIFDGNESWYSFDQEYYVSSIETLEISQKALIKIFPVPTNQNITVISNKMLNNTEVIFYDLVGNKVKQFNNIFWNELSFEVNDLRDGMYFIRINEKSKNIFNGKFIVE